MTALNTPPNIPARFAYLDTLGEGRFKAVLLCHDTLLQRPVAIAQFNKETHHELALREARALSYLSEHPRITTIYDAYVEQDQLQIVMQHLPGGTLRELLTSITELDARKVVKQIAAGLNYMHRQGFYHGDLKPENILLDDARNAYLSDFGFSNAVRQQWNATAIYGTPKYLSPEVKSGAASSPSADLFAFGVILSELCDALPAMGPRLKDTIDLLCDVDPSVRHLSIAELSQALDGAAGAGFPSSVSAHHVNRTKLLDICQQGWESTPQSLLLLLGPAGQGKTCLANDLLSERQQSGSLCVFSSCPPSSVDVYLPIRRAVADVLAQIDAEAVPADVQAFAVPTNEAADRGVHAALSFLEWVAAEREMVWCLDDAPNLHPSAQWFVDELIASALRRALRLRFVFTARSANRWLNEIVAPAHRIEVPGLSHGEAFSIARTLRPDVPDDLFERWFATSAGNPLHLVNLARSDDPALLEDLDSGISKEVAALSGLAFEVLAVAAMEPAWFDVSVVANALGHPEHGVLEAMASAERKALVTVSTRYGIEFTHPLIAEAVMQRLTNLAKDQLCQRLTEALAPQIENDQSALNAYLSFGLSTRSCLADPKFRQRARDMASAFADQQQWARVKNLCLALLDNNSSDAEPDQHLMIYYLGMAERYLNNLAGAPAFLFKAYEGLRAHNPRLAAEALRHGILCQSHTVPGGADVTVLSDFLNEEQANTPAWSFAKLAFADLCLDRLKPADALTHLESLTEDAIDTQVMASEVQNISGGAYEQTYQFDRSINAFSKGMSVLDEARYRERNESAAQLPRPLLFVGDLSGALTACKLTRELHQYTRNHRQLLRATIIETSVHLAREDLVLAEQTSEESLYLLERTSFGQLAGDVAFQRAQVLTRRGDTRGALRIIDELLLSDAATEPMYASISNLYKSHIDPVRHPPELRAPKSQSIDPFRMNRVCLNVALSDQEPDQALLGSSINMLRDAYDRGMVWTNGWLFSIPKTLAQALDKTDQKQAAARIRKSMTHAKGRHYVAERT